MNHSGFRPKRGGTVERTDARALPQFRLPSETVHPRDESEVVQTVERPPVRIRRVPVTPPRTKVAPPSTAHDEPPPITSEVDARDILLEAYVEPVRPARPRPPLPSAYARPAPPPLPAQDRAQVISFSSLGLPSDRDTSSEPAGRTIPPAPVTLPMLAASVAAGEENVPSTRRATLETTPSLAPVAMSTSLVLPSRAGDPTMQLRPRTRRSAGVVAALSLVVAAMLAGAVVAIVAVVQGGTLGGHPIAFVDRLMGRTHEKERTQAAAPSVATSTPVIVAPSVSPSISAPAPVAVAPPDAPVATTPSIPVDALPKPAVDPELTLVTLPRSSKGHRIFVDGRAVGHGPAPMTIKCGMHKIQIGSAGKPRMIELPCGGELTVD